MSSRAHFESLDALRGIAAGVVVVYHLGHWLGVPWLAANGQLSVDFFFCLSGFVLAMAYGPRHARRLTMPEFLRLRMIRLMPLVWIASILSAIYVAIRLVIKDHQLPDSSLSGALFLSLLSLPNFSAPSSIGGPQVFPLNGPQYTLFLEIVVNIFWFALRVPIGLRMALTMALVSWCVLWTTGLGGDMASDFLFGVPRVSASFFLGVAVFFLRQSKPEFLRPVPAALLFSSCAAVFFLGCLYPRAMPDSVFMVFILILFPAIVFLGSYCRLPARVSILAIFLGELSYPIYVLHYPIFCWINGALQTLSGGRSAFEIPLCFALIVLGSWAFLAAFDRPARRWLSSLAIIQPATLVRRGDA